MLKPAMARMIGGTGASIWVDRPASRLSKRITKKPRSTSSSHNSRSQWISCIPRPITKSRGVPEGSPRVS